MPSPQRSPYDPGSERLAAALVDAFPGCSLGSRSAERLILWLPTVKDQPIPSSSLIAEPPEPAAAAELKPWTVAALRPPADQVIDLLCACMGKETLATGVIVGKTLAFWATALRFAGAEVAREQFLPGLEEKGTSYRARWEPVFSGTATQRLKQLAVAMPPACRACSATDEAAPDTPALAVLTAFVETMVDDLVRSTASPEIGRGSSRTLESVHDHWLHALASSDGALGGAAAEQRQLAEQVREWQRPITVATATPFRLCFRLEEPEEEGNGKAHLPKDPWHLRYLLQAADDPSLFVPVADAWAAKGRKAAVLKRDSFDAREYLLSALGQAVRICPVIEESLKTSAPAGYDLDTVHAHVFLTQDAWMLEQAGFGVLLPAWWSRKGTKLRLSVRANVTSPKMQGTGLSLSQIITFDWQVALGEETLTLAELETLAKLKAPLVKVRGQWVQLTAEEIQAALDYWKKNATGQASVRQLVQMALGGGRAESGGIAFGGITATGWIDDLLAQLEGRRRFEELPAPEFFRGTLRPYQVRGYSWLAFLKRWGLGACLADDMGLGKTIQTLALIQRDWHANGRRPTLLICPMSVVGNWQKEAERFTPELPVLVHHGGQRQKGSAFEKEAAETGPRSLQLRLAAPRF